MDDQELLFHEEAVGDYGFGAARSEEFGDRRQQVRQQHEAVFHGGEEVGEATARSKWLKMLFSGQN